MFVTNIVIIGITIIIAIITIIIVIIIIKPWIKKHLPYVDSERCAIAEPCLYTMSPNSDFVLDAMPPPFENVVVGGGFSGHVSP